MDIFCRICTSTNVKYYVCLLFSLESYCIHHQKIFIFRNGGKIRNIEKWHLNNEPIVVVDQFLYLGIVMNSNGNFITT